jgi:CBS domain-containing protein
MVNLGDVMARAVVSVAPEDTLGEAAQKMVDEGVGSAVVLDHGRLIGILTERDLLKAAAGRVHSSEARVREWMTEEPITASSETGVEEAVKTMLEYGFRHLPVVEEGRTVGVVSLREVVRATVMAGGFEGCAAISADRNRPQTIWMVMSPAATSHSAAKAPISGASGRREGRGSIRLRKALFARRLRRPSALSFFGAF